MSAPTPHAMDRVQRSHSNSRLSSVAVESADVVLDKHKMYTVEWRDGAAFGFTVTPVNSDCGTVLLLARRTARREQLEASGLQDVVPGDLLVMIGGEKVYQLGAENATRYLRSVKKPVRLMLQLSPYGNQDQKLPDLAPNEYHYEWVDGPLGIVLTLDTKSKLPMVKRLSDKANDVVRRNVQISDQLIYANDVPASEYTMDEVMSLLREMPKPVLLRFRKQLQDDHLVELPELAENEFEFLWDYGPLGLVIGMSRAGLPFVRSFTGLGTSRQLGLVEEDDEIVMVNDKSACVDGFREIMQYLMNVPKPAVLRFRRKVRGSDDRASQLMRESSNMRGSSALERPSTMKILQSPVPDCTAPLSPVNQLGMSSMVTACNVPQPPPSPQVRVSMDRNRFRSVSSEDEETSKRMMAPRASATIAMPQDRNSMYRGSSTQVVGGGGRQTIPSVARVSEESNEFAQDPTNRLGDDNRSSPSGSDRDPRQFSSEDRETAILPPDPRIAGRSSIFTFQFDDGPPPAPASPVETQDRGVTASGAARTGSSPPQPDLRSQSQAPTASRSSAMYQNTTHLVAEPVLTPTVAVVQSTAARQSVSSGGRASSPSPLPAAVLAPMNKTPQRAINNQYVDTADLFAEPVVKAVPRAGSNQSLDTAESKAKKSASSRQLEDTSAIVANPLPKPTKKSYEDTADLFAEPTLVKKTAAVAEKQPYEDTAELSADSAPAPRAVSKPKQIVNTADLVAEPTAPAKKPFVDTAELFAEPPAPVPKQAPKQPAPVAAKQAPKQPAPVAAKLAPRPAAAPALAPSAAAVQAKPTPSPLLRSASSAESQENFTIDEAAFYTVQWTEGPFGSTVREANSSSGPVMLITKRTGKHTCAGLRRIAVGDILVRIGDQDIPAMGFEKATRYLRRVPKPVPLTFQAID